jgi:hypothetical protein
MDKDGGAEWMCCVHSGEIMRFLLNFFHPFFPSVYFMHGKNRYEQLLSQRILALSLMVLLTHTVRAQWIQTIGPCGGRVNSLAVSGENIFAGTYYNGGIFRRLLSEMIGRVDAHPHREIIQEIIQKVPLKTGSLSRFGSTIAIEFTIPHSDHVAVTMYDLAGKEMSSLVKKYLTAGSYRYLWDTHAFARGCYAVRLQAGEHTCMKIVQIVH